MTLAMCTGVFTTPPAFVHAKDGVVAAAPAAAADVALADGGVLTVRVIDSAGNPAGGRRVRVLAQGAQVAAVTTDSSGTFQVSGLREGLHEVEACSTKICVRLWEQGVAPPHAEPVACIVCGNEGEAYCQPNKPTQPRRGPLQRAFANYPLATTALIGAGIGAAIAIPIAVSQKPASP
jgi:hypothetical protein